MQKRRVIIIGAGPGGLAASLLLAKAGVDVTIIERHEQVGGRTSTMEAEGFKFDLGPTFFHYPRVLGDVFEAIGRDLMTEVPMVKLDPQYSLLFGDGARLNATNDVEEMQRQIAAICEQDAAGFPRFMDENRVKLAKFRPCLEAPFQSVRDLFRSYVLKVLPWLNPHRSLDTELKRYFSDPRLRIAFSFQSKYLGMSPYRCPSLFSILSFLEYEFGVFHPIGGCGAVTRRMGEIAEEMGVNFQLGEKVEEVLFEGDRAVGVRTDRDEYHTDALIMNADFAKAMEHLVPNEKRRRWTNEKLAKKDYSCSTFMLYLGIEGCYDLPHHTIYIADDYQENLREIEQTKTLSQDPSFYIQNACVTDPSMAPEGQSGLYVLVPVANQTSDIDWNAEKDRYRDLVVKQLEKAGYTGLEERIVYEKCITPHDWEHQHLIYNGAVFNLAHSLRQMLHLRPRNRFEDFEGMYLVGGGTHPGSGLPVIFESARITSKLLLDDFEIDFPGPAEPLPRVDEEPLLAAGV